MKNLGLVCVMMLWSSYLIGQNETLSFGNSWLLDEAQKDNLYILLKEREQCLLALDVSDELIANYERHIKGLKRLNLIMGEEARLAQKKSLGRTYKVGVVTFFTGALIGVIAAR